MESIEKRCISQEFNKEKESYEYNAMLLERAKDKFVEMGIFDKEFLHRLSFVLIDKVEKEGDEYNNYQLTLDGKVVPLEINDKELTRDDNFFTYTKTFLDSYFSDPESTF